MKITLVPSRRLARPPALAWAALPHMPGQRQHLAASRSEGGGKVVLRYAAAKVLRNLADDCKGALGLWAHLHLAELLCHGCDVALQVCAVVPQLAQLRGRGCSHGQHVDLTQGNVLRRGMLLRRWHCS